MSEPRDATSRQVASPNIASPPLGLACTGVFAIDVRNLPETIPIVQSIGLPIMIDHMGRTDARACIGTAGFELLRLLGQGGCWVKVSGAHRLSDDAPDYPEVRAFHQALVAENPERLVWGGDWPHPRMEAETPDVGHLYELFHDWTPDAATRRRYSSTTRRTVYGFAPR